MRPRRDSHQNTSWTYRLCARGTYDQGRPSPVLVTRLLNASSLLAETFLAVIYAVVHVQFWWTSFIQVRRSKKRSRAQNALFLLVRGEIVARLPSFNLASQFSFRPFSSYRTSAMAGESVSRFHFIPVDDRACFMQETLCCSAAR